MFTSFTTLLLAFYSETITFLNSKDTTYFNKNLTMPFLYEGKVCLSFEERFQVLFMDIDASKICTMQRSTGKCSLLLF